MKLNKALGGVVFLGLAAGLSACGGGGSNAASHTSTTVKQSVQATTTTVDACAATIQSTESTLNTFFDRVDADPADAASAATGTQLNSLMTSAGTQLGMDCSADPGGAISTLLVYLSSQGASRPTLTGDLINGFITGFCKGIPASITLTQQAQAACAVTSSSG